jgi:hypothetical protein
MRLHPLRPSGPHPGFVSEAVRPCAARSDRCQFAKMFTSLRRRPA